MTSHRPLRRRKGHKSNGSRENAVTLRPAVRAVADPLGRPAGVRGARFRVGERAPDARAALSAVRDWDEPIEYRETCDDGRRIIVTPTAADIVTQLALHEVHHRAQAMHILTRLGVGVGDIDYNLLMYQRREVE